MTNNNNPTLTLEHGPMSIDRTINIIGVFGVIVSLIFVGYEAREANPFPAHCERCHDGLRYHSLRPYV